VVKDASPHRRRVHRAAHARPALVRRSPSGVEAKEGVKIERENQTLATITIQNYFRMYAKLAGMTGTADTEASSSRNLQTRRGVMPPNKPMHRVDHPDVVYKSDARSSMRWWRRSRIATPRASPSWSAPPRREVRARLEVLKKDGVKHNVLNAINHEPRPTSSPRPPHAQVTIATNMAGRGRTSCSAQPEFLRAPRWRTSGSGARELRGRQQAERYETRCAPSRALRREVQRAGRSSRRSCALEERRGDALRRLTTRTGRSSTSRPTRHPCALRGGELGRAIPAVPTVTRSRSATAA